MCNASVRLTDKKTMRKNEVDSPGINKPYIKIEKDCMER